MDNSMVADQRQSVISLSSEVQSGVLPLDVAEMLRTAIAAKENILVIGGTSAGKTTFCNSLLHTIAEDAPDTRMLIVEDVRELQCALRHSVFLQTDRAGSMTPLNEAISKMQPGGRICLGEARYGREVLALLRAWSTDHPGGLCTMHVMSACEGLIRLDQLISEVSHESHRVLIGETMHIVVYMEHTPTGRRVRQVIRVHRYDPIKQEFEHEMLYEFRDR